MNVATDESPVSLREREGLPSFLTEIDGVTPFANAHIASALKELLPKSPAPGSSAFIIGGDGPNIFRADYTEWREHLVKRLRAGCNDIYLLVNSDVRDAINALREIVKDCAMEPGKLRVYHLRAGTDEESQELFDELLTKHFLLIDKPQSIWYEGNHPSGETFATGCYFFNDQACRESALWDVLKSKFDFALAHSEKVI